MIFSNNDSGFPTALFKDAYDKKCSIQCSSAIDDTDYGFEHPGSSFLWVGILDAEPQILCKDAKKIGLPTQSDVGWQPYNIPENILLTTRMHLNREQIKDIINVLQEWLDTGILN